MANKKILVVEDAREDRMRFRHLFEKVKMTEDKFEFAWAWPKDASAGPGVEAWFFQNAAATSGDPTLDEDLKSTGLRSLAPFAVVLLDLAWSSRAERLMRGLQGLPLGHGRKLDTGGDPELLKKLVTHVEGIAFLEKRWRGKAQKPAVWVTSAYTPTNARELRDFINERYPEVQIFHKWIDEHLLRRELEGIMRTD